MAWRPHFAYPTPPGFVDELADFPFDYRQSAPALGAGGNYNLALPLDSDAVFMWRGLEWCDPVPYFFLAGTLAARIKGPMGDYLMDNFVPLMILGQPYYVAQPWIDVDAAQPPSGPFLGAPMSLGMGVALVEEIKCPASSVLTVDLLLLNPAFDGTPQEPGRLLARGVKRRPLSECGKEYRS